MVHVSSHLPAVVLTHTKGVINFDDETLQCALALVILAPLIWNIVARTIRNVLPASTGMTARYAICYVLAVWIFGFSSFRDVYFHKAVDSQPQFSFFSTEVLRQAVCGALFGLGQLFVLSSFWRLGVTGTFLGDYCGIFMKERVTGFPFSVLENPMYVGSTMSFVAYSLWNGSVAGLLIAAEVALVYYVALKFEGPYTTQIYLERDAQRKGKGKKAQ